MYFPVNLLRKPGLNTLFISETITYVWVANSMASCVFSLHYGKPAVDEVQRNWGLSKGGHQIKETQIVQLKSTFQ